MEHDRGKSALPLVMVTGADGQLGRALRTINTEELKLRPFSKSELDVCDAEAVEDVVNDLRPDFIVNAAAYTAVDDAEREQAIAYAVNRDGAVNLATACVRAQSRLIQISTDYVFDGKQSTPYQPQDPTNPLNVYGASKLAGERAVQEILGDYALIIRTAWLYSLSGPSFLTTMLQLMKERDEVRVVEDQIGTPTSANSLARAVVAAVSKALQGVHHWTDAGVASWYDFAVAICEEANASGLLRRAPTIVPIATQQYPTAALRPERAILDKTETRLELGLTLQHWRSVLRDELKRAADPHPS